MDSLCIPMNVFCHAHHVQRLAAEKNIKPASHARSAAVDNLGTWKDTDSSFQRSRKIEGEKNCFTMTTFGGCFGCFFFFSVWRFV